MTSNERDDTVHQAKYFNMVNKFLELKIRLLATSNESFGKLVYLLNKVSRLNYSFFKVAHCTLNAFDLKRKKETLNSRVAKFSLFLQSNLIKRGSS